MFRGTFVGVTVSSGRNTSDFSVAAAFFATLGFQLLEGCVTVRHSRFLLAERRAGCVRGFWKFGNHRAAAADKELSCAAYGSSPLSAGLTIGWLQPWHAWLNAAYAPHALRFRRLGLRHTVQSFGKTPLMLLIRTQELKIADWSAHNYALIRSRSSSHLFPQHTEESPTWSLPSAQRAVALQSTSVQFYGWNPIVPSQPWNRYHQSSRSILCVGFEVGYCRPVVGPAGHQSSWYGSVGVGFGILGSYDPRSATIEGIWWSLEVLIREKYAEAAWLPFPRPWTLWVLLRLLGPTWSMISRSVESALSIHYQLIVPVVQMGSRIPRAPQDLTRNVRFKRKRCSCPRVAQWKAPHSKTRILVRGSRLSLVTCLRVSDSMWVVKSSHRESCHWMILMEYKERNPERFHERWSRLHCGHDGENIGVIEGSISVSTLIKGLLKRSGSQSRKGTYLKCAHEVTVLGHRARPCCRHAFEALVGHKSWSPRLWGNCECWSDILMRWCDCALTKIVVD